MNFHFSTAQFSFLQDYLFLQTYKDTEPLKSLTAKVKKEAIHWYSKSKNNKDYCHQMKYQKSRHLYDPKSDKPFAINRSKIDLFLECPKCFYLDCRLGLGRTSMPSFSLNSAVDALLKKEFDLLRKQLDTPGVVLN